MTQEQPIISDEIPEGHRSGFVAVVGRANVGKSTLINLYVDQKVAIVSKRPQTTRRRQLGIITKPDHQLIFVDTPGIIRKARHQLDSFMLDVALGALSDADAILWLVDAADMPGKGDREIAEKLRLVGDRTPVIIGMNKADLLKPSRVIEHSNAYRAVLPDTPWLLFSAKTGAGVEALYSLLVEKLPEGPRYYPADQVTDLYVRNMAGEVIREKILRRLKDEIPHTVAVEVVEYKERDNGMTFVSAEIIIEREAHKKILIGKGGAMLKNIGRDARYELEKMLETKVFLKLWVKVEKNWRRNPRILKRLGYHL